MLKPWTTVVNFQLHDDSATNIIFYALYVGNENENQNEKIVGIRKHSELELEIYEYGTRSASALLVEADRIWL